MLTARNAIDHSPIDLRESFDTPAISILIDIICMHQKTRYEKDIRDALTDENNLIYTIATNGKLYR